MRICITGPIATADVAHLLDGRSEALPVGYIGAPLTGVLIGELVAAGCEVIGITIDYRMAANSLPCVAHGPGFEFHVLPGRQHAWRFNGTCPGRALDLFRQERRRVAEVIRRVVPDVVHAHWTYEFALGAIDSGVPHVITAHDSPWQVLKYSRSPYRALRLLMAREVLSKACCVTAVSGYIAGEIQSMTQTTVSVVPNPVAAYVLKMGTARAAPNQRRIGMVCNGWGRLKNPEPSLRAFGRLRDEWPSAELHLFGADFGLEEAAQSWAASVGLGTGMVFHGSLPHRELIAALEKVDLLLHPALEESFGVVLAEAMALGLPVVAGSRSGAVPWVLGAGSDGLSDCGVLVDVSSVDAIVQGVRSAFGRSYTCMSSAGLARARLLYSPHDVAAAYRSHYLAAVAVQGTGSRPGEFADPTARLGD